MNILPLPVKKNKFGDEVRYINSTDYYRQITEEVLEAYKEAVIFEDRYPGEYPRAFRDDEAIELVDIITCCITRLDILGFDETKRQELFNAVNEKNRKRGYLED